MNRRLRIVAEALTWEGTPYHHQACVKGVGVDCAMLLVGIARACGLIAPQWAPQPYSPEWHYHQVAEVLESTILALGGVRYRCLHQRQPGDIVTFRLGVQQPMSHAGVILPEGQILHALAGRSVVRHALRGRWHHALAAAYAFPGSCL